MTSPIPQWQERFDKSSFMKNGHIKDWGLDETIKYFISQDMSTLLDQVEEMIGEDEKWHPWTNQNAEIKNDFRSELRTKLNALRKKIE